MMKGILPFLLPLLLLQIHSCSSQSDHSLKCVKCHTDFCETITCTLSTTCMNNETYLYSGVDTPHTLSCEHKYKKNRSCDLMASDGSSTAESTCHLVYKLNCMAFGPPLPCEVCFGHSKNCINKIFKPLENIKMNPPGEPVIINNTISWSPGSHMSKYFKAYSPTFQLQWRQEGQPWKAHSENQKKSVDLPLDSLTRGQWYQAQVRVMNSKYKTTWSDWSPTASWIDTVGTKPLPLESHGPELGVLFMVLGGSAVVFVVCFLSVLHKTPPTIWIYMEKKIRPHIPNPAKFFEGLDSDYGGNFKDWLGPLYTCETITSVLQPVAFSPVEITDSVDNMAPRRPEGVEKKRRWDSSDQSSSSCFSNGSYSPSLHPTPPLPPLEACSIDSPYGPVCEHSGEGERGRGREEGMNPSHERAKKLQAQRQALQSPDSGMASGREDQESQESLEDSGVPSAMLVGFDPNAFSSSSALPFPLACFPQPPITLPGMGLGPVDEHSREGERRIGREEGRGDHSYEHVEKLQAQRQSLQSPDLGMGSRGEDQESLEDSGRSTAMLGGFDSNAFSCSSPLPFRLACFSQPPFTLPGMGLGPGPGLDPSHPGRVLEKMPLLPSVGTIEPSGDGYI